MISTDEATARSYSDIALKGAIAGLTKMHWRGEWGEKRLEALKAERDRRKHEDAVISGACSRCGSRNPNEWCHVCRTKPQPEPDVPDEDGGSYL